MPFPALIPLLAKVIPPAVGALSSILSARKKSRTASSNWSQTSTSSLSPEAQSMFSRLMEISRGRLDNPSALPAGYTAGGLQNINDTFGTLRQSIVNRLTARGLGGSPVAGNAEANLDLARGGEAIRFQNQLPLLERELQNQDLDFARLLTAIAPRTTTASGTGERIGAGDPLAVGVGSLAEILGELLGRGKFGGVKLPNLASTLPPFDPRSISIPRFPGGR